MSGNSYGKIFKVTTFGESHGRAIGVIVDGVPANIDIDVEKIQYDLDRRRPGQSRVSTARKESDKVEILSGVFEGKSTGTPIAMAIFNEDQLSKDYSNIAELFRPGHADYTFFKKYGIRDYRGGGRSSGRETAARVAAGAIAKMALAKVGVSIVAWVGQVGPIICQSHDESEIENNIMRAPDPVAAADMEKYVVKAKKDGDSCGGVVECRIRGLEAGLGEPVFDKLDAKLAQAALSIGTVKGIEFGAGFKVAEMYGSQNNDEITASGFKSNNSGGILGGISNGDEVVFRIAVKPTASIYKKQTTVDQNNVEQKFLIKGRHDPCICPRVVPVIEAMSAITVFDLYLRNKLSRM
ncbi:MAG: chorismate synthase [Spirochaetales bacterium]|nr:chorismate synthase [Spirochaetales bacterium]